MKHLATSVEYAEAIIDINVNPQDSNEGFKIVVLENAIDKFKQDLKIIKTELKRNVKTNHTTRLPKFVKLKNTALRLKGNRYYRDGGDWYIKYKIIDGVLLSWFPDKEMPWLHKKPLIEISEKEWREDNGQYAPKRFK